MAADAHNHPAVLLAARRPGGWSLGLRTSDRSGRLRAPVQVAASRNGIEGAGLFAGRGTDLVAGWLEIVNGSRRPVVATGPRLADRQVLAPGPRSTQFLRIAANRRGDAVVAFWRYDGQSYSVYAAFRPAGARFQPPQLLAAGFVGNPAVAIDQQGTAVVAWMDRGGAHVAERPAATAAFGAPAINTPGRRIPHWITPIVSLVGGQALVAWVQGDLHTTTHDRAALAIRSGDGPWQAPIVRGVRAPVHVYYVGLLARAPGRPPILALTTSRAYHWRLVTATLRDDATLGPSRPLATAGDTGFAPWLAQGRQHAWLGTERTVGTGRRAHRQALLFRSR